ncbi:hypothetical protein LCGC14_1137790 [marine sediment metagenome]|uniref:Uncharacterized protein n=1 Tax=marine sediment metagenome TaxID=412755 RepID=A0A0F9LZB0_9ZZZZ
MNSHERNKNATCETCPYFHIELGKEDERGLSYIYSSECHRLSPRLNSGMIVERIKQLQEEGTKHSLSGDALFRHAVMFGWEFPHIECPDDMWCGEHPHLFVEDE